MSLGDVIHALKEGPVLVLDWAGWVVTAEDRATEVYDK
jgi:hypothetical protein